MPLSIGNRNDPAGYATVIGIETAPGLLCQRNVSVVKSGRAEGRGCSSKETGVGHGDDASARWTGGTCHFEERPWGGETRYSRAKIFRQISLSFHLPNANARAMALSESD